MINGKAAFKKSQEVSDPSVFLLEFHWSGRFQLVRVDTFALVVGPSPDNPDFFTVVRRFVVTDIEGATKGKMALKIKKWDSMTVDDYSSSRQKQE